MPARKRARKCRKTLKKNPEPRKRPGSSLKPQRNGLFEERQDDLRRLVGDRKRLGAELLLHLQGLQPRALPGQVRVDQIADAGRQLIGELLDAEFVVRDLLGL